MTIPYNWLRLQALGHENWILLDGFIVGAELARISLDSINTILSRRNPPQKLGT